jgi:chromosomal replication initiation ATPase DnaA
MESALDMEPPIDAGPMRELLAKFELLDPLVAICKRRFVELDWVLVGHRHQNVVRAREECCLFLRELEMSYYEIGRLLGMDHTSVISSVRRAKKKRSDGNPAPAAPGETPK